VTADGAALVDDEPVPEEDEPDELLVSVDGLLAVVSDELLDELLVVVDELTAAALVPAPSTGSLPAFICT
jgi:hypothetical protein